MEKLEYDNALKDLENEFQEKKKLLNREYAIKNSLHKVGDIFQDHIGRIRVESVTCGTFGEKYPSCIFFGTELNKNGSDNKKGKKRQAWQCNELKP